jgi:hypothetical protein
MANLKSERVLFARFQGSNRINNTSLWVDDKLVLAVIRNVHHGIFNATIISPIFVLGLNLFLHTKKKEATRIKENNKRHLGTCFENATHLSHDFFRIARLKKNGFERGKPRGIIVHI